LEQQLIASLNKKVQENVDGDGDKSNEQWLQLIRFLRREKEIATSKMEMAEAQSERMHLSLKNLEMRHEELKVELGRHGSDNTVGLLTSVKQAELMRKVETLSALSDSNRYFTENIIFSHQLYFLNVSDSSVKKSLLSGHRCKLQKKTSISYKPPQSIHLRRNSSN
jgi:hypothetical protein